MTKSLLATPKFQSFNDNYFFFFFPKFHLFFFGLHFFFRRENLLMICCAYMCYCVSDNEARINFHVQLLSSFSSITPPLSSMGDLLRSLGARPRKAMPRRHSGSPCDTTM